MTDSARSDTELSRWQLAKHIAGGLPIGLLLGFSVGSAVFVLFASFPHYGSMPVELPRLLEPLFVAMGAMGGLLTGISVTGLWLYHAEDISTGIRLSEVYGEDTE